MASKPIVRDAEPVKECAKRCGLCAEPGDIYCDGCRAAIDEYEAMWDSAPNPIQCR